MGGEASNRFQSALQREIRRYFIIQCGVAADEQNIARQRQGLERVETQFVGKAKVERLLFVWVGYTVNRVALENVVAVRWDWHTRRFRKFDTTVQAIPFFHCDFIDDVFQLPTVHQRIIEHRNLRGVCFWRGFGRIAIHPIRIKLRFENGSH